MPALPIRSEDVGGHVRLVTFALNCPAAELSSFLLCTEYLFDQLFGFLDTFVTHLLIYFCQSQHILETSN
jgi:hypothetical protein